LKRMGKYVLRDGTESREKGKRKEPKKKREMGSPGG